MTSFSFLLLSFVYLQDWCRYNILNNICTTCFMILFYRLADRRNSVFLQSTWTLSSVTYPQWLHSKFIGWLHNWHIILTCNFSEPHDLQIVSVTFLQIMPFMFTYYSSYIVYLGDVRSLYIIFYNESRILKNHFYCYTYCIN